MVYQPYRWASADFQIGVRPMRPQQWILFDGQHAQTMREKRERLTLDQGHHYRTLQRSLPAQWELREKVLAHLLADHAERFTLEGRVLQEAETGLLFDLDAEVEPLRQLSEFIVEDFMLVEEVDGALMITAASNAYSSSGRLVGAVGRNIDFAHQLVPTLNDKLGVRINRVLSGVHVSTPCERFNWQLTPLSTLFFPREAHAANAEAMSAVCEELSRHPELAGERLFIRVERQTLSRLPDTRAIAFSLHTYSEPLQSLKQDPKAAAEMLKLLSEYAESRWHYTEMDLAKAPILAWLSSVAG